MLRGLSLPNVKRLPRGKRCGEASLHQGKRQDLKQEVRAYGVLPLFPHAETGADWYGGMGEGELFPLGVFYAAACTGIGETDLCLVGRTKGESALASYRCAEAVFPVAGMVRRIPYTKGGLSMVRSLARRLPA